MILILFPAWRLSHFFIYVTNNAHGKDVKQCAFDNVPYKASESRTYNCPIGMTGRFVRLAFEKSKREYLQLCEVQVYAKGTN